MIMEVVNSHSQSIAYWTCILCMLLSGYLAEKSTHLRRIFTAAVLLAVNWAVLSVYYLPMIGSKADQMLVGVKSMMTVFSAYLLILVGMLLAGEGEYTRVAKTQREAIIARLNRRAVRALGLMVAPYTLAEVLKAISRKGLIEFSTISPIDYDGWLWVTIIAALSIFGYWWIWKGISALDISDRPAVRIMRFSLKVVLILYSLSEAAFVIRQWIQELEGGSMEMPGEFQLLFSVMKFSLTILLVGLLIPRHGKESPVHYEPAFQVSKLTGGVRRRQLRDIS
jgi:hypothetical protein